MSAKLGSKTYRFFCMFFYFWIGCHVIEAVTTKWCPSDETPTTELYLQSVRARRSPQLSERLVTTENTLNLCDTLPPVSRHALTQFGGVGAQWDRAAKWEGLVTLSGDVRGFSQVDDEPRGASGERGGIRGRQEMGERSRNGSGRMKARKGWGWSGRKKSEMGNGTTAFTQQMHHFLSIIYIFEQVE